MCRATNQRWRIFSFYEFYSENFYLFALSHICFEGVNKGYVYECNLEIGIIREFKIVLSDPMKFYCKNNLLGGRYEF